MLFNSFAFLVFFPIAVLGYFLLPHRHRWWWLLATSTYFYMSLIPVYVLILYFLIVVDYTSAIFIEKSHGHKKRVYLIASILTTCIILFFFKYFNFFNQNIAALADALHWNYSARILEIVLPIGLSFHTFQSLSYVIEVYRGKQKAERHFGIYAVYVMFFPQLVAGPIERPQNLLHQFREHHKFDLAKFRSGLLTMLWGFFKKVVIADRLAVLVSAVYAAPGNFGGPALVLATVLFAFQIYCDFSGYSSIAVGSAEIMGFSLMENFRRPYFAKTIREFWTRWHISLSTWFRDYVYYPLGGSRVRPLLIYRNFLIVFIVSGLWHGANWTFIIWGALHGLYMVGGHLFEPLKLWFSRIRIVKALPHVHGLIQMGIVFVLVCIGWVFFRAANFTDAMTVLTHSFSKWSLLGAGDDIGIDRYTLLATMVLLAGLLGLEWLDEKKSLKDRLFAMPQCAQIVSVAIMLVIILLFGVFDKSKFIYFQF